MRIYRLEEADKKKARFINNHPNLEDEQKEYLLNLYLKPEIPDNIVNWQKIKDLTFKELKEIAENYLKEREEKKSLSKAIEGRDYIKLFENTNEEGTEYLYLPLTWLGSKYLASDHFLPKIKVPSKVMQANDFADNTAKNDDLSPGAKWCISLWTIPDLVIYDKPFKTLEGKELRHEGKRYWLNYTVRGAYFLFYFRDYNNLDDIDKKVAFTLVQGSSKIEDITLADDTRGKGNPNMDRIQKYWDEHYQEYKPQIEHIQEVSKENRPKFEEYEEQKMREAIVYRNFHGKEYILIEKFTYNEETERYDSKGDISRGILDWLTIYDGFTVPLGVINGNFDCSQLSIHSLKNGPTEVKGNFSCSNNRLTTLEGAPEFVGGNFRCYDDSLLSLKGAPKKIEGDFTCWGNRLTTLEGAPEFVGEDFDCSQSSLISLKGSPKYIGKNFDCSVNKLKSLEDSPEYVGGSFNCSYNNLTTLRGATQKIVEDFNCSYNRISSLRYAPKEVGGDFSCYTNKLKSLKGAPREVKGSFFCYDNKLTTLEGAPEYIGGAFDCTENQLNSLEGAPKTVEMDFYCGANPLQSKELSSEVKGYVHYY